MSGCKSRRNSRVECVVEPSQFCPNGLHPGRPAGKLAVDADRLRRAAEENLAVAAVARRWNVWLDPRSGDRSYREIWHGSKRGQVPLCEAPCGPFRQRYLTPF